MKRTLAILIALAMSIMMLTACGSKDGTSSTPDNPGDANQTSTGSYPGNKNITLYCGYSAGGSSDTLCRLLAAKVGEKLGTTVTVDMIVEDANRVQSEEYQEEIYAVNFSKSVDDIRESMTLDNDLMIWADASAWSLAPQDEGARIKITDVIYDFDWENITPGVYDITFATKGSEYKVATTDRTEPGDLVGLRFTPDDIHIMRKGD